MKKIPEMILTIVLILAVLGYTFYNYSVGKTDATMLIVCAVILGWPLINIVRGLIEALKNK